MRFCHFLSKKKQLVAAHHNSQITCGWCKVWTEERRSALYIGKKPKCRRMEEDLRTTQKIEAQEGLEKQLVVRHVKAHVTSESKKLQLATQILIDFSRMRQ